MTREVPKAASAAIAKKGYNAQRDGDEQHNGQERAQQQAEAEADRNALAGKEPSIPVDGGPREERDGILVELACGARQLDIVNGGDLRGDLEESEE